MTHKLFGNSITLHARSGGWCLALVMLLAPVAAQADVTAVEEFEFELSPGGRLSVENVNGDISIVAGPGNKVQVTAYKKAGDKDYLEGLEIRISADEDRIRIRTEHPDRDGGWFGFNSGSGSVSYEITAPGDVHLDSIDTVNGEIDISGISGDVSADTTNGGINVTGLRGNLNADTVNGGIDASFETFGVNQRLKAETVNGRITLRLPADTNAEIDAGTVNGGIDAADFGLEVDKGFLGRDLEGEIGAGEGRIKLSTVNGRIRIRKI